LKVGDIIKKPIQLIIKNATYFAADKFNFGHILVENGQIKEIVADLSNEMAAETVIDAAGKHVFPGLVDCHVHFREPGYTHREDFFSGSCAAAAGGFTMVFDMPNVNPPTFDVENLRKRIALAEAKSLVDFAFYGAAGFANRCALQPLIDAGVFAFKTFLNPAPKGKEDAFFGLTVDDDGQLFLLMQEMAKTKARFVFHCENYELIKSMEKLLCERGETGFNFHYKSRPAVAEVESVATVIAFAKATGVRVGIAHITVPAACALVKQAKKEGMDIIAETCFQYLIYDESYIDKWGPYAKCNPPLRSKEQVEKLWDYVADGTISMVGSDHAPFVREEKEAGISGKIWQASSGLASIEVSLPLMLTQVAKGRLVLEQIPKLMSENICKNFGLYPKKGCIQPGADADFTIIDAAASHTIDKNTFYTKGKDIDELFDGEQVQGKVVYTIGRGRVLFADGRVNEGFAGSGVFVGLWAEE